MTITAEQLCKVGQEKIRGERVGEDREGEEVRREERRGRGENVGDGQIIEGKQSKRKKSD